MDIKVIKRRKRNIVKETGGGAFQMESARGRLTRDPVHFEKAVSEEKCQEPKRIEGQIEGQEVEEVCFRQKAEKVGPEQESL